MISKLYLRAINALLSQFNLEWTNVGLKYIFTMKYGSMYFFVSNDFDKVLKFLNIPDTNSDDIELLALFISNSDYYNRKLFNKVCNDNTYNDLVDRIKKNGINKIAKTISLDKKIKLIDSTFKPVCKIQDKVLILNSVGINKKEIRNKFNGKLVMKWTGLNKGPLLANTIEEFKEFIEKETNNGFLNFLNSSSPRLVRNTFNRYYNHLDYILDDKDDLPF